ncbi:lysoplasmalogenase family protein [Wenxinia marina]|uniref:Putative membrane protein n=1 Tax=Wenxinia marina DSM 24838 TaxID=1123501 RepID=A0A0D0Q0R6_9RHOB|nr:lysoplasmalogenase family protein [Wenxinia marina]KIQ68144.1 putative membrane protein [Wenxinia marina DSM 24838]GGL78625.1 lysoplasmalogenase [Wenxinia marina]
MALWAAGAGLVSAAWYLVAFAAVERTSALRSAVKTVAIATLAGAVALSGGPALLALALALGAAGDLALSRPGERAFLAGVAAFALAHLVYVALLAGQPAADLSGWRIAAAVALCTLAAVMAARLWRAAGALRGPVVVYAAIIVAMGFAALRAADPRLALSAGLFVASDAILAAELFLLRPGHPARRWTPYAVWILYVSAQWGLALSLSGGLFIAAGRG